MNIPIQKLPTLLAELDQLKACTTIQETHPSAMWLLDFLQKRLTPEQQAETTNHLATCAACEQQATELRRNLAVATQDSVSHEDHFAEIMAAMQPQSLPSALAFPHNPSRSPLAKATPLIHKAYFDRLSDWINDLFSRLLPLQLDNSDTPVEIVEHKFDSSTTDPFRARLVQNTAGEWSLRVFTSDAEAAKLKLRLEIKEEAPVLAFVPGLAGHYMAEVAISEQMAHDLQSGHRPVFHPVETM